MDSSSLSTFFKPRGIAVVGASMDQTKLGHGVARNLVQGGFAGAVHLVNAKGGELFGKIMHKSLADVPDPVDLAVLIVPASATPSTLIECAHRGIRSVIVESGGFREVGAEGAQLEAECMRIALENGIRFLGPNCIGLIDTHLPLDTTFLPPPHARRGDLAFLSHSGAFCAAVIDWSQNQGIGFSRLVSLGNQADVTETDLLELTAQDDNTRVICLYLESIRDGRRFIAEATRVTRRKPIVALKVGRSASGQRAAASHTGALAGSESAYEAAFEKSGVLRADTAEQMFDWARALAWSPLPRGWRMAVLTNAGGPGVIATDALEANGLLLAQLADSTTQVLSACLPPAASLHNPVDMLASASPETYALCLKTLLTDPGVDGAIVVLPPPPMFKAEDVAMALIPIIGSSDKPVLIALMGSTLIEAASAVFQRANVPAFPFPERAASALAQLARRSEFLNHDRHKGTQSKKTVVSTASPEELVAAYGIQTVPLSLVRNESEARTLASQIGFPLVAKIASADILHKSDIGGVMLDIHSSDEAVQAFDALMRRAKEQRPNAKLEGVTYQRQIPAGQDVIVGMARDAQFGALIMFGAGGVEVEGLKDVAFALAPLSEREADRLIERTWAGKKLSGFRSIPAADKAAVKDALIKLAQLACDHPEIAEIEINPLRALSQGAVALDIRVKISTTKEDR